MHQAAEHGIFHTGMQVDEARGERRHAEIFYFFIGITQTHHLRIADVGNGSIFDENSAMFDRFRRNRNNIFSDQ